MNIELKFLVPVLTILFFLNTLMVSGQVFDPGHIQDVVRKASDKIYNAETDSASYYINKAEQLLPDHPVIPLMRGMNILWTNIPMINEEVFREMELHLDSAIDLAKQQDPDLEDPEMIFFAMASYGLLAEYHADQGTIMKAVGEAQRAYGLMKKGFEIVDEYEVFLLTTGLYNYFREKYPEQHPLYKPLLWFFRSGDMELGLRQVKKACESSFLIQVEAHVYLSYIFLRYEFKPKEAQFYLDRLCKRYPNNFYAKAKYLESLANPVDFKNPPIGMIYSLIQHKSPYYRLAGLVFLGYYEEVILGNKDKAIISYKEGLQNGEAIPDHGEFFKSFGYLGLARVLLEKGEKEEAEQLLKQAVHFAETEQVEKEAKTLLSEI